MSVRLKPQAWLLAQVTRHLPQRLREELFLTPEPRPKPRVAHVPTRHGAVRCLVYAPPSHPEPSEPAPVVVYLHSGGFVRNDPRSEEHLVVHLAVDTGVWVVCVDYGTAPTARYPQAEEQCYDATTWVADPAQGHPWDTSRMAVVGASAGGKLVLNVCQQLRDAGQPRPASAAVLVPVTDLTRSDRTSSHPRPIIDHRAQQLMLDVWIPERWRRNEPLASPRFDPELPTAMPPTLVQTAALDTLGPEGEELVSVLRAGGVDVRHHRFADLDHGFGATDPRAAREAIEEIGAFLHETLRLDDRSGGTP